ncbi:MAG: anion permease, partial [Gammaproteobacteria bacterium]|nr:anion permease [Gammaproteobacteria bacterium]
MKRQTIGLLLGPVVFLLIIVMPTPEGLSENGTYVAAVAALMAIWWISEAAPIPATALLPIALFPLFGVMEAQQVTTAYANHLIYLFMGGFLIAVTIEKWNLHKRIALHTVLLTGTSPNRIILGFMVATAFLSMWISNTAAAMMMVTIGLAVVKQTKSLFPDTEIEHPDNGQNGVITFGTILMLGIAYASSIGGVATLIGTPPNAILAGVLESNYNIHISFGQWMLFALPLSIIVLALTWLFLTRIVYRSTITELVGGRALIHSQLSELGNMQKPERRVLIVFISVAASWLLNSFIEVEVLSHVT